jgi:hypothetical protein
LNFILKLQKLKIPKLYIQVRPTTLLYKTFSNYASILKLYWGDEKGVKFEIWIFSKLLQILHWNFENSKHQSCSPRKDIQTWFYTISQILLRFWFIQKGVKSGFCFLGFSERFQIETWYSISWWLISDHTITQGHHWVKYHMFDQMLLLVDQFDFRNSCNNSSNLNSNSNRKTCIKFWIPNLNSNLKLHFKHVWLTKYYQALIPYYKALLTLQLLFKQNFICLSQFSYINS